MRRLAAQARAESLVRAARASAALDGAELPLDRVRELVGAQGIETVAGPGAAVGSSAISDPVRDAVVRALRVTAAAAEIGPILATAPLQALARLHLGAAPAAASTAAADRPDIGRPRPGGTPPRDLVDLGPAPSGPALAERLDALGRLIRQPSTAPALVVAAIAHGELLALRPFTSGNGLVARALARALTVERGLDPTGVAVPEVGLLAGGPAGYVGAAAAYTSGTAEGVALWLRTCAEAVVLGAGEGRLVADAVLAGRLTPET